MASNPPVANALDPDIPAYPGASPVNIPQEMAASMAGSNTSNLKDTKYAFFATPDSRDKIEAFYSVALSKAGWSDQSSMTGGMAVANVAGVAVATVIAGHVGGPAFTIRSKQAKVAAIAIITTSPMAAAQMPGVPAGSTLIIIVSSISS